MVNFRDPVVIAKDRMAVLKLWHIMAGLYLWEFVTTLDYEWSVLRGHRPYRWTMWIYCLTRVAALMAVILNLVSDDVTTPYNCEIETIFGLVFGYLAFISASVLIVLRIIAIWKRQKMIIVIATIIWAINVAFIINGVVRIRSMWVPEAASCLLVTGNVQSAKANLISTLITDTVLLVIMLIGLLRLGFHERGTFGVGRLLWKQGLIWLLITALVEVSMVVFICLNLNDPFNYMLWLTSIVVMTISATRIHRYLADFASETTDAYDMILITYVTALTVVKCRSSWSEPPQRPSKQPHVHTDGHGLTFSSKASQVTNVRDSDTR
ncbi:hypothetical protein BC827DRAFT_1270896 [Russula dissimulans]|nr:hypothetical protein BC827DRAFT_1270896 [Russula dissimulans]